MFSEWADAAQWSYCGRSFKCQWFAASRISPTCQAEALFLPLSKPWRTKQIWECPQQLTSEKSMLIAIKNCKFPKELLSTKGKPNVALIISIPKSNKKLHEVLKPNQRIWVQNVGSLHNLGFGFLTVFCSRKCPKVRLSIWGHCMNILQVPIHFWFRCNKK